MSLPSLWLSYDMSPIGVLINRTQRSILHLLVRFCAVCGGVFAVTGVFPSLPFMPTLVCDLCGLHSFVFLQQQYSVTLLDQMLYIVGKFRFAAGLIDQLVHKLAEKLGPSGKRK